MGSQDELDTGSKYQNLDGFLSEMEDCYATKYFDCGADSSSSSSGLLSVSRFPMSNGDVGYTFELFDNERTLLKVSLLQGKDGVLPMSDDDSHLLDDLDSILANVRAIEIDSRTGLPIDEKYLELVAGSCSTLTDILSVYESIRSSGFDQLLAELKIDENLGKLLANCQSRCQFDGEEWKVSAEDNGIMNSVTATSTQTGRTINFTVLTGEDLVDEVDGKFMVTECPSGMDKATVAQRFLSEMVSIEKKSIAV